MMSRSYRAFLDKARAQLDALRPGVPDLLFLDRQGRTCTLGRDGVLTPLTAEQRETIIARQMQPTVLGGFDPLLALGWRKAAEVVREARPVEGES